MTAIIAFVYVVVYYNYTKANNELYFPQRNLRFLAGLFLGILVYLLVQKLNELKIGLFARICMTIIEELLMVIAIIFSIKKNEQSMFVVFCFVISLIIMLSNQSFTGYIKSMLLNYIGKLSMIIYIVHIVIKNYASFKSMEHKTIIVIMLSIFSAVILHMIMFLINVFVYKKIRQKNNIYL